MLVVQSAISGQQRPKSSRKPLQLQNSSSATPLSSTSTTINAKKKPFPAEWIQNANKENIPPVYCSVSTPVKNESNFQIESWDASLAEQLIAIREKLERLRIDKDKTEKMLTERSLRLYLQLKAILERGDLQKQLEIEVDRLYRLKEIKLSCMRISPVRSLRDKEQEKKIKQDQLKANNNIEERDEQNEESPLQSPNSEVNTDYGVKLSQFSADN